MSQQRLKMFSGKHGCEGEVSLGYLRYTFHNFLRDESSTFDGIFLDNVKILLDQWIPAGPLVWRTSLVNERSGHVVPIFAIQEDVTTLLDPGCPYCVDCGWGKMWISKYVFHFLIPAMDKWQTPIDSNLLRSKDHILHGTIHGNGYGHLVSVHDSKEWQFISCEAIMNIWEQLCSTLHCRAVSVVDKIWNGYSWFRSWGYQVPSTGFSSVPIKWWSVDLCSRNKFLVFVHVKLEGSIVSKTRRFTRPADVIMVPSTATKKEVAEIAERVLTDTYPFLMNFKVKVIEGIICNLYGEISLISDGGRSGMVTYVSGTGVEPGNIWIHESGIPSRRK